MTGPLRDEASRLALLGSIVEMTRAVFAAGASSITRYDPTTRELVFEAVAGAGADSLVGRRIPADTGLGGWALASEQPIAVGDVVSDPRFARDFAESTGYVPERLIVYPLLTGEDALGVISVLDQGTGSVIGLAEMDVLGTIAAHAASILALVIASRADADGQAAPGPLAAIERSLASADPMQRDATLTVLSSLERLLALY